jgi:hypothetical protein
MVNRNPADGEFPPSIFHRSGLYARGCPTDLAFFFIFAGAVIA